MIRSDLLLKYTFVPPDIREFGINCCYHSVKMWDIIFFFFGSTLLSYGPFFPARQKTFVCLCFFPKRYKAWMVGETGAQWITKVVIQPRPEGNSTTSKFCVPNTMLPTKLIQSISFVYKLRIFCYLLLIKSEVASWFSVPRYWGRVNHPMGHSESCTESSIKK